MGGSICADLQLTALDDAAFKAEAARRIEPLTETTTAEEAKRLYCEQALPCDAERIRRNAERRRDEGEQPVDRCSLL